METKSGKVFVASALGAGIGTLIALSTGLHRWWIHLPVGLLVGGIVGYFSYEWRTVVRAIPRAARWAGPHFMEELSYARDFLRRHRPTWRGAWTVLSRLAAGVAAEATGASVLLGMAFLGEIWNPPEGTLPDKIMSGVLVFFIITGLGSGLWTFQVLMTERVDAKKSWRWAFFLSPIGVALLMLRGIVWCVLHVPAAARFLGRFAWKLFLLVHSEERLICGVDAMIGAAVGFLAGRTLVPPSAVLIGALAGGVLGVANYEIVTRRLLVPRGLVKITR